MATVHDVTAYILEKQCPVSAMKLQKLVVLRTGMVAGLG